MERLESLRHVITSRTIVAIASTKQERVGHDAYTRLVRWKLGTRVVTLLRLL